MTLPFVPIIASGWLLLGLLTVPVHAAQSSNDHATFTAVEVGHYGNFIYRIRLLTADDGGLVGICLELLNESAKKPLTMRLPAASRPVAISLYNSEGDDLIERLVKQPDARKDAGSKDPNVGRVIEWKIEPLGFERRFISLHELLGTLPTLDRNKGCTLYVYPLTVSSAVAPTLEGPLPARLFTDVIVTRKALQLDAGKAYKSALIKLKGRAKAGSLDSN